MIIDELSRYSDSELLDLVNKARGRRNELIRSKTNRYGVFKKLPRKELDKLVKRFQLLVDDIKELESLYSFEDQEILKQVLELATSNVQIQQNSLGTSL